MKVIGTILCKVEKNDIRDEKLTIPNNITEIANNAFYGCTTLKEINIPKSIKIISPSIFKYCDSLEKINFESSIFYINTVEGILGFFNLKSLKSINICGVEFKSINSLMVDLENQEKYQELVKREVFGLLLKKINLFVVPTEKNEIEYVCRTSKTLSNYIEKITYNILNIEKYDYKKTINLLTVKLVELYYGINQNNNNQTLIIKS